MDRSGAGRRGGYVQRDTCQGPPATWLAAAARNPSFPTTAAAATSNPRSLGTSTTIIFLAFPVVRVGSRDLERLGGWEEARDQWERVEGGAVRGRRVRVIGLKACMRTIIQDLFIVPPHVWTLVRSRE